MQQYNKTKQEMMNFDDVTKGNMKEHNPNWPIPDHPYRILTIGALDLEKTIHYSI